ncbi:hypothetical protein SO694_00022476 [Aureococcus anophagefferens]|uniref:Uncharacterized protein n=1 Tax=Aureococcus anophagefferens TaxID=44056 RepID=A0ABR1FTB3_AURAN
MLALKACYLVRKESMGWARACLPTIKAFLALPSAEAKPPTPKAKPSTPKAKAKAPATKQPPTPPAPKPPAPEPAVQEKPPRRPSRAGARRGTGARRGPGARRGAGPRPKRKAARSTPAPPSLAAPRPKRGKVDDSSLVGRRVRAGGCFTHDLNPTPYDGEVESHDAATNTYVVYWPADDSETVYTERQLRRVLV